MDETGPEVWLTYFFQSCVPSSHIDTGRESNYNIGSTEIVEYCMGGELSGILYPT